MAHGIPHAPVHPVAQGVRYVLRLLQQSHHVLRLRVLESGESSLQLIILLRPSVRKIISSGGTREQSLPPQNMTGYDMHCGDDPAYGMKREYATDLFTNEAIKIIENHELPRPLYLQISHLAVHAPIEQPDDSSRDEIVQIREPNRRKYASKEKKEKKIERID